MSDVLVMMHISFVVFGIDYTTVSQLYLNCISIHTCMPPEHAHLDT